MKKASVSKRYIGKLIEDECDMTVHTREAERTILYVTDCIYRRCSPFLACFSLRFFNVASAAGEADGPVMEANCVRN